MSIFDNVMPPSMPGMPGSSPSPSFPAGAPGPGRPGPSGSERFAQVMNIVLPLLASAAAFKQGQLGTFTNTYLGTRARHEQDQQAHQYRQHQMMRQQQQDQQEQQDRQMRIAQMMQQQADREAQQVQAAEDRKRQLIEPHVRAVAENPLVNALVGAFGPESLTLKEIPGVGVLPLEEALRYAPSGKVGVLPPKPKEPAAPRTPLVTTPGPDGKPIRAEDRPGVSVYERPRVPPQPKEPKEPTRARHDTFDVKENGFVWRVTLDADTGAEIRRTKVRAMTLDEIDDAAEAADLSGGEPPAAPVAPTAGPPKGTKRTIKGVPAVWDGKGWLPVK